MTQVLDWLSNHSLPVAIAIILGAAFLYVLKVFTDKSIEKQFDRYSTRVELQLQRRSRFEELILTRRFEFLSSTRSKLDRVFTNINRMHRGTDIEGFRVNDDIVPLTEVFEDLNNAKYLISEAFFDVLQRKAALALEFANARNAAARQEVISRLAPLNDAFDKLMIETFNLNKIEWNQ